MSEKLIATDLWVLQAQETISQQQAEIDRLTEQRDMLLKIVSSMSDADICNSQHHEKKHRHGHADDCPIAKIIKALISEIEAWK